MPSSSRKGNQFGWPSPFRFEPWKILISIGAKSTEMCALADSAARLTDILTANAVRCELGTLCAYIVEEVCTFGSASWMMFLRWWMVIEGRILYGWWKRRRRRRRGESVGYWA